MAKLDEKIIEVGRNYVLSGELQKFYEWCYKYMDGIDIDKVKHSFEICEKAGDKVRSLKLFDTMVNGYDTNWFWHTITLIFVGGFICLIIIGGFLGGCVYLFNTIFN